jgi:hypothetical protein
MSSEQSLDPQLIEQTKQQIRALVNEIAQLTKSGISPEQFYAEFLPRVVSALAALGGAIWTVNEDGRLALQYQMNLGETRLHEREEDQARHGRLLHQVMRSGEGVLVPPQSGTGDEQDAGNPTDFLLVLGPLKTELETLGVVEILQRPDTGVPTQKGYLRFLTQMCDLAAEFFKSQQLRHFSSRQVLWTQLESFAHVVHSTLDPRQAAYIVANEARRLIDCDRVSVAIRKGRKCTIESVSGQDVIDKRSNIIRLLGRLATEVVAAGDPIWYTGDTGDFPPQIEDAIQEYVDESHSKAVAILPLSRESLEPEKEGREKVEAIKEGPFGALIIEQIEDSRFDDTTTQRIHVVCRHSATALGNALEYRNIFLMPVWRALGKTHLMMRAKAMPKIVAGTVAVVALLVFLAVFPARFKLEAKGSLEPDSRRDVFARIDGVVDELLVNHGDMVKEGQLLGRLRNTELEVSMAEVVGQRTTTQQEVHSIERVLLQSRDNHRPNVDEENRQRGRLLELRKNLESLDAKYRLFLQKQEDLKIMSPISGRVVTWDLHNRLIHRPVQRGQVLMRVGDLEGKWILEIRMPENEMGHVAKAQQEIQADLPVEYILASEPGTTRTGKVREVHYSAEVRGDEGNTVLIKADINQDEVPKLRPGTSVSAKVLCGERALGYVWFHDVLAFIQSRILFRWF